MEILKCEMCEIEYFDKTKDSEEYQKDFESIKETKKCVSCYEEFGNGYADRAY